MNSVNNGRYLKYLFSNRISLKEEEELFGTQPYLVCTTSILVEKKIIHRNVLSQERYFLKVQQINNDKDRSTYAIFFSFVF